MDASASIARLREAIENLGKVKYRDESVLKDTKVIGLFNNAAEGVEQLVHYIKNKGVN